MTARKPPVRKLTVYSEFRKDLTEFEDTYGSIIIDCSTPKGMKSAKDCRKEIRDVRCNLEDARKEAKAPHITKGKQVDDEAKELKGKLDALYEKFDSSIKAIENKKAIEAAAAAKATADKLLELDERERAIFDKEVELGLRDPIQSTTEEDDADDEALQETTGDDNSSVSDDVHNSSSGDSSDNTGADTRGASTICEPHIKAAAERLGVLKAIRNLVEPSDAQPDGSIDEKIAENHDAILADIWELVDVFN